MYTFVNVGQGHCSVQAIRLSTGSARATKSCTLDNMPDRHQMMAITNVDLDFVMRDLKGTRIIQRRSMPITMLVATETVTESSCRNKTMGQSQSGKSHSPLYI